MNHRVFIASDNKFHTKKSIMQNLNGFNYLITEDGQSIYEI